MTCASYDISALAGSTTGSLVDVATGKPKAVPASDAKTSPEVKRRFGNRQRREALHPDLKARAALLGQVEPDAASSALWPMDRRQQADAPSVGLSFAAS
jgi:hypothetical protein